MYVYVCVCVCVHVCVCVYMCVDCTCTDETWDMYAVYALGSVGIEAISLQINDEHTAWSNHM